MQKNKSETKEWVNIRVSPQIKKCLMIMKAERNLVTYDAVLKELIEGETKWGKKD